MKKRFRLKEMYESAGKDLTNNVFNIIGKQAYEWYYSSILALGGKSPYEYCQKGNISEIEDLLGRIEHWIIS